MVNKVILLGYVGKDPEVRHLDTNLVMARFTLATTERWTKDGNKTEATEWHNIVMWRELAEVAEKYVRKGRLLYIEGRLRSRSYDDKDGVKRHVTEILADTMQFVGPKADVQQQQTAQTTPVTSVEPDATTADNDAFPPF